jgi:hypothetical protein
LRCANEHTYSSLMIAFIDKVKSTSCYYFSETIEIHTPLRNYLG